MIRLFETLRLRLAIRLLEFIPVEKLDTYVENRKFMQNVENFYMDLSMRMISTHFMMESETKKND